MNWRGVVHPRLIEPVSAPLAADKDEPADARSFSIRHDLKLRVLELFLSLLDP
jgi:hypothetical protein